MVNSFAADFATQLVQTSALEWVAVLLALAYVWLAARQHNGCWVAAFVSTAIYTWLFWQVTLPFQSILNLFYMVMAVYGYWQWQRNAEDSASVVSWPWVYHLVMIISLLLLAYGLARLAASWFSSDYLLLDAAIQVFSVVTTFMVAHKVLQNWLYWLVINSLSAWLCAQNGLALSSCLFVGYTIFALYGYKQWRQQWAQRYAA